MSTEARTSDPMVQHCQDCCCARSWKALGINEYTGLSIPEHIERLREDNDALRHDLDEAKARYERLLSRQVPR